MAQEVYFENEAEYHHHRASCFIENEGKFIAEILSKKLVTENKVRQAKLITYKAFQGDDICRTIINTLCGPQDWISLKENY